MTGLCEGVVDAAALFLISGFFYLCRRSTTDIALVAAEDQDGRQEDSQEQLIFREEQSDEDSDSDPEQDKPKDFFHEITVLISKITYSIYNICGNLKNIKNKNLFHFY